MMSFYSTLKYNARLALRGNWGRAALVSVSMGIVVLLLGLLQQFMLDILVPSPALADAPPLGEAAAFYRYAAYLSIPEVVILTSFSLLSVFLLAPVALGITGWFWELIQGGQVSPGLVFRFFESFRRYCQAVWFELTMTIRALWWAIVFLITPCAVLASSYLLFQRYGKEGDRLLAVWSTVGFVLGGLLLLFFLFLYIAHMNRYTLAPYLLCSGAAATVGEAVRISVASTKGHRFSLLWFRLSFAGWWLLSILLLGIPLLFLKPYVGASTAAYSRYLLERAQLAPNHTTQEFVVGDSVPDI